MKIVKTYIVLDLLFSSNDFTTTTILLLFLCNLKNIFAYTYRFYSSFYGEQICSTSIYVLFEKEEFFLLVL